MSDTTLTSQLLTQLLSVHSPEFGARLKQRLNTLFVERGLGHFDERAFGYKKFHDFLEQAHGDLVRIERPSGSGDILVWLCSSDSPAAAAVATARQTPAAAPIRSDVWQAFSNPDPARKRFLHKQSYVVRHFVENDSSPSELAVRGEPGNFIEIEPIPSETQMGWMKSFLDGVRVPAGERAALDAMLNEPYSSGVNAAFTRALGLNSTPWRHYRTRRVLDHIHAWATQHEIPLEALHAKPRVATTSSTTEPERAHALSSRDQVTKVLELFTDDEISKLVLPTLLSMVFVKSRI
ncbi:OST-HTH/LOTUS domain-containing protein [Burkholderia glumae]